ncbi:MAG: trigger factor [Chloroflexota bacterium]|nr:trigger factor [Chloroflexota bacterium]
MKVTTSPAPRSSVLMEVELPADRLQRSIDESVRHLGRRTRVPGFRPGKVPRPVLERALGVRRDDPGAANPIYEEAKEHLFEASVVEALRQTDLEILSIPQPEWVSFAEGSGATYRLTLPIRPQVKLGAYADYPFGISVEEVDDPKVDAVVEQLRDQQATLVPVEGRGAENGDYAVIAFRGTKDGVPFEGGTAERFPLVIGRERMIPGFEDHVVGMAEGDERTFALTFPADYPDESLAGQTAEFHVTMLELRRKVLPDADDEFARSLGDYADLNALRGEIRRRLEANARDRARHAFADRIIEFAVANATVDVPDLLVEREMDVILDELKLRLGEQGIAFEEYLRVTGRDEQSLRAEQREAADKRVKTLLVVGAIADAEQIEVGDAEVEAEIERARQRYAENPRLVAYFESERGRSYLRSTLRRTKTVEALVDRWLAAHPEAGDVRHLEDEAGTSPREPEASAEVAPASLAQPAPQETKPAPERVA